MSRILSVSQYSVDQFLIIIATEKHLVKLDMDFFFYLYILWELFDHFLN